MIDFLFALLLLICYSMQIPRFLVPVHSKFHFFLHTVPCFPYDRPALQAQVERFFLLGQRQSKFIKINLFVTFALKAIR
jgi:hypothetical protein